jgi:membrane protein
MRVRAIFELIRETVEAWTNDRAERLGAAFAYYTLFSMTPMLVVVIVIAGAVFGQAAAQDQIIETVENLFGPEIAQTIESMIDHMSDAKPTLIGTLISLGLLLYFASGLFANLKDALNLIWGVKPKPGHGVIHFIRTQILAILMVLFMGFLLMVALALNTLTAYLSGFFGDRLPGGVFVWQVQSFAASFALIMLLVVVIYRVLPDGRIAWRDIVVGAAVTSLLVTIGTLAIGIYLALSDWISSTFGAAGPIVAVLIWAYYFAQVFFFGVEFTQVFSRRYGSGIRSRWNPPPAETATSSIEES